MVLLAEERSRKVAQFTESWASWGFAPDAVVIRSAPDESRRARLASFVREHGVRAALRRAAGGRAPVRGASPGLDTAAAGRPREAAAAFCAARGIPVTRFTSLDDPSAEAALRALDADLFVLAGVGIVRPAVLAVPRLGTLNVHMGLLPAMRGMNVAEWSAFTGAPVGCTVHVVDRGVDTGGIIVFRPVEAAGVRSIDALRHRVDEAQVVALGEVVRWVVEHGELPPACPQRPGDGRQYFAMPGALRARLEGHLRGAGAG